MTVAPPKSRRSHPWVKLSRHAACCVAAGIGQHPLSPSTGKASRQVFNLNRLKIGRHGRRKAQCTPVEVELAVQSAPAAKAQGERQSEMDGQAARQGCGHAASVLDGGAGHGQ